MANEEPRAWTLQNTIMAALGALILVLLGLGYAGITKQIEIGDIAINKRMDEICSQIKSSNDAMLNMIKDVSRIDTLQKQRLEREVREDIEKRNGRMR